MPDLRDYTEESPTIVAMNKKLGIAGTRAARAPAAPPGVDLRGWCSPVEDQGMLNSCTAHAAAGVVEYFQRRAFGTHLEASRLFIYKSTRSLMKVTGDTGAWLRSTMGALVLCGVPDETYWPYTDAKPDFDADPGAFVYAVADNYQAVKFFCHDPVGVNVPPENVLANVKKYLVAGIPSMLGFYGFPSFEKADVPGGIPFPCPGEKAQWGHAIVAVGFDDTKEIANTECNRSTTGALLIRNSWGTAWGDVGYGWLPYAYVVSRLAVDFWSLISMDWVSTKQFGI
jgi:C1A family cysteine protease